uniref:PAP-associated domain-containing protein n=1 Tax=Alexandrium catenella TaxID=2925 RepID=A0A7S1RF25_ALECA|mmetsp:Transcript_53898/g.144357  ORF Transcript_53898/g.144357 Transcript_53898/m.144357 type:complete len:615 (+) Transcript_53898:128-1972(+)
MNEEAFASQCGKEGSTRSRDTLSTWSIVAARADGRPGPDMREEPAASHSRREVKSFSRDGSGYWLLLLALLVSLAATFVGETVTWQSSLIVVGVVTAYALSGSSSAGGLGLPWPWHQEPACHGLAGAQAAERAGERGRAVFAAAGALQRRHAQQAARRLAVPRPELRQDSKVPVRAPTFSSEAFSEQVSELLTLITPTVESERLAQQLAQVAKTAIQQVFPEVEVVGFASGDVARGTAFGVAVPELDIVASASPHVLVQHLQGRLSKGGLSMAKVDARKLQKSAIRVCTDYLVSEGGFKFRRSAFRGQEPKVTLMAPANVMASGKRIAVDFSVNSMTPLYNARLITECGSIDMRAKSLILLVRRWAKDRGVCHAAKGHLAPYAWTLLAIYFMQVGVEGSPILPPLQGFKMASGLTVRRGGEPDSKKSSGKTAASAEAPVAAKVPVSELFIQFVRFYSQEINWHKEAVSVRLGRRASANLHLMLHIIVHEDQSTEVGPSIEDPFEPARNLGMSTTSVGMARLREEFARARTLTSSGTSLSEIIEPWAPSERARGSSDEGGDREEEDGPLGPDEPVFAAPPPSACPAPLRPRDPAVARHVVTRSGVFGAASVHSSQ